MKSYRTSRFALFVALGMTAMAIPARAAQIQWSVRGVESDGIPLTSVSDAQNLLDGAIPSSTDITGHYNVVNFNELSSPLGGLFGNNAAFPGTSPAHQTDFAAEATATVKIPTAGKYTFGISSDDGFAVKVGPYAASLPGLRYPGETYATFDFIKPGNYPVDLVFFQHQIAAELEFFATKGAYTDYGQKGSDFQLVGDVAHGGLELVAVTPTVGGSPTPEPSGLALFVPLAIGLLRRRRRCH